MEQASIWWIPAAIRSVRYVDPKTALDCVLSQKKLCSHLGKLGAKTETTGKYQFLNDNTKHNQSSSLIPNVEISFLIFLNDCKPCHTLADISGASEKQVEGMDFNNLPL
jgi:hypothetical protein